MGRVIVEKRGRSKNRSAYVVVSGRPGRVQLHVELSLLSGQLVVLGLFLPGQCVPLEIRKEKEESERKSLPIQSTILYRNCARARAQRAFSADLKHMKQ